MCDLPRFQVNTQSLGRGRLGAGVAGGAGAGAARTSSRLAGGFAGGAAGVTGGAASYIAMMSRVISIVLDAKRMLFGWPLTSKTMVSCFSARILLEHLHHLLAEFVQDPLLFLVDILTRVVGIALQVLGHRHRCRGREFALASSLIVFSVLRYCSCFACRSACRFWNSCSLGANFAFSSATAF